MSAVVGAIDLMDVTLPEGGRDAVIEQSMRVAQSGSRRVLGLIDALLDISHLQSGQLGLELVPMDLFSIVDVLMPDFMLMANEYGLIIRNEVPDGLPTITADQDKIVRVLSNLLDNAVKFTPAGGQVRISASMLTDDMVAVCVKDAGPGIPEEYREKIFERFWQVPGQRTRRRGSGLGLAFCKLAIEAHGGEIWVETPQDGGSLFTFTLPVRDLPT
jgi:signal transduction histidine kinase